METGKSTEDKNLARIAQQKKRETAVRESSDRGQGPSGRKPLNNGGSETEDPDLRIRSKLEAIRVEGVAANLMNEHAIKAVDPEMERKMADRDQKTAIKQAKKTTTINAIESKPNQAQKST
ncbi:MAG TPA: hypothetical protein VL053_03520 [Arachidicoccus sp.]|nr:hypothetical protein [Arachidicoccus sp.]